MFRSLIGAPRVVPVKTQMFALTSRGRVPVSKPFDSRAVDDVERIATRC
jgi:hypothetical protein